ncbi:unnamed protein product [Gadus morhua 'NCC']
MLGFGAAEERLPSWSSGAKSFALAPPVFAVSQQHTYGPSFNSPPDGWRRNGMVPGAEREQRHQEKEEKKKEKEEEKEAHGWSTLIQGTTMFFFHDRGLVPPPPPPPGPNKTGWSGVPRVGYQSVGYQSVGYQSVGTSEGLGGATKATDSVTVLDVHREMSRGAGAAEILQPLLPLPLLQIGGS